jgi:hypothetical protein
VIGDSCTHSTFRRRLGRARVKRLRRLFRTARTCGFPLRTDLRRSKVLPSETLEPALARTHRDGPSMRAKHLTLIFGLVAALAGATTR